MLPLEKNPCDECLVSMLCEQMCPKVIDFYSKRVRKRSKSEVEQATGYYWEDDYTDNNGVIHPGQAQTRKRQEKKEEVREPKIAVTSLGYVDSFINWLKT